MEGGGILGDFYSALLGSSGIAAGIVAVVFALGIFLLLVYLLTKKK